MRLKNTSQTVCTDCRVPDDILERVPDRRPATGKSQSDLTVEQLIRRYWHRSRDGRRHGGRGRVGRLLEVTTASDEPDSFLEKHGMARDRRPTSDLINVVPQSHDRCVHCS